jgi:hypothetical protein
MEPTPWIGTNAWYWAKNAEQPLAALVTGVDENTGFVTLCVFTEAGGRFTKKGLAWRREKGAEGWSEIAQTVD